MLPRRLVILAQILHLAALTSHVHAWVAMPAAPRQSLVALQSAAAAAVDYEVPEDAVITIKPKAMKRLQELRQAEGLGAEEPLVLRMGVRSGGCSGTSGFVCTMDCAMLFVVLAFLVVYRHGASVHRLSGCGELLQGIGFSLCTIGMVLCVCHY